MRSEPLTPYRPILALLACAAMTACGGGGGSAGNSNQPPVASATLSGQAVLYADTVFDISASSDPDGQIVSHAWDYGDGQTGSSDRHVYAATGNFTATLTVTDDEGATGTATVPVAVAKCSTEGTQVAALSPFTPLCMQTSAGEIVFEVFEAQAPVTAANFLRYVDEGFYSGLLFHRVDPTVNHVIQGGGFKPGLVAKAATHPPIALESNNGLKNQQYSIGMARTAVPDSATTQFYVNLVDNPGFDYDPTLPSPNGYAVFGKVLVPGTAVVDAISTAPTTTVGGLANVPVQDILIRSIVRMP
jgi:cyclophilin family peptidyl-prolyl cis-trans isomerase